MVNGKQEASAAGEFNVTIDCLIRRNVILIEVGMDKKPVGGKFRYVFPLICSSLDERVYNFIPGLQAYPILVDCRGINN